MSTKISFSDLRLLVKAVSDAGSLFVQGEEQPWRNGELQKWNHVHPLTFLCTLFWPLFPETLAEGSEVANNVIQTVDCSICPCYNKHLIQDSKQFN